MSNENESPKMGTLRSLLVKMGPQLAAALPRHIDQGRFLRVMLTTIRRDRKGTLLSCSTTSILGAMMQAAQDGLELDGMQAALVPFKDNRGVLHATYMPMYRGLIAMARRSGEVSTVRARAVYAGDEFTHRDGLNPVLDHVRGSEEDPAKITHFYAIAELKDGGKQFEVMTRAQVEAIRNSSKGYQFDPNGSPWSTDFEPMGCKTIARRLLKWCPCAAEVQRAITRDEEIERGQMHTLEDFEVPQLPEAQERDTIPSDIANPDKAARIAEKVRARSSKPEPTPNAKEAASPAPGPTPKGVADARASWGDRGEDDGPPPPDAPPAGA